MSFHCCLSVPLIHFPMAHNLGPDSKVTQCLESFILSVEGDFSDPSQSSFQSTMPKIKREIQSLEEVRQGGREGREGETEKRERLEEKWWMREGEESNEHSLTHSLSLSLFSSFFFFPVFVK